MPLSVAYGQAEVFFPIGEDSSEYVLKVFHKSKQLDCAYLNSVGKCLPGHPSFRCGKERKILTDKSLGKTSDTYYASELASHLVGSVLMPRIRGFDWMSLSNRIRTRERDCENLDRLRICRNLAEIVQVLENHQLSHRDLSSGNLFIDPTSCSVSLIDFDSMYHPHLVMPRSTTIGTEGYTAPFVGVHDTKATFSWMADRFALAILFVEILILDAASPSSHEGGIFQQDELYQRKGKTISYAESILLKDHPEAAKLFKAALNSPSFQYCPRPGTWASLASKSSFSVNDLPEVHFDIQSILKNRQVLLSNIQSEKQKGDLYGLTSTPLDRSCPPAFGHNRCRHPVVDLSLCYPTGQIPLDNRHLNVHPTFTTADIQFISSLSFANVGKNPQ